MSQTEATAVRDQVRSAPAPSLASDLSWLLLTAASPSVRTHSSSERPSHPPACAWADDASTGREELAERVRRFWGDTDGRDVASPRCRCWPTTPAPSMPTDPDVLWAGPRAGHRHGAAGPGDCPRSPPRSVRIFSDRLRRLKESPDAGPVVPRPAREVWAPVDDMWQQCAAGSSKRPVDTSWRNTSGERSLDLLITPGCDIFRGAPARDRVRTSRPASRWTVRPLPVLRLEPVPRGSRPRRHRDRRRTR